MDMYAFKQSGLSEQSGDQETPSFGCSLRASSDVSIIVFTNSGFTSAVHSATFELRSIRGMPRMLLLNPTPAVLGE